MKFGVKRERVPFVCVRKSIYCMQKLTKNKLHDSLES